MNLNSYFQDTKGIGILATTNNIGKVDAAIFSKPHILEDGNVAFIMRDRLTHANLQTNPHAAYLFLEEGGGYKGKRFFLTKIREEKEGELLNSLKRRIVTPEEDEKKGPKYLVIFKLDKELPLIGASE